MRKKSVKYLVAIVCGLAVAAICAFGWGINEVGSVSECYRILADSFTIPGVMMSSASVLIWISSKGGYDVITYGFSYVKNTFNPNAKLNESFYDYKIRREEKRLKGCFYLLWVGLGFIAVAVVFTVLFNSTYTPPVI